MLDIEGIRMLVSLGAVSWWAYFLLVDIISISVELMLHFCCINLGATSKGS